MIAFERLGRRVVASGACLVAASLLVGSSGSTRHDGEAAAAECDAWQVEYSVSGNLQLSDTPMGAGNGTYLVGPGRMVLRFERSGAAQLVSYEMPERFGIEAKKVFWTTHVNTDALARATAATPGPCGHAATGAMKGSTLVWSSKLDFRTDGTLECKGSMCGKFGAPAPGSSPLHIGPSPVMLEPLQFGPDGKTFTMASTFVSKTESPKQTAYLSLSGREARRSCAPVDTCR
jgi:hypothetical protein